MVIMKARERCIRMVFISFGSAGVLPSYEGSELYKWSEICVFSMELDLYVLNIGGKWGKLCGGL